jgi:hypothetical protein
VGVVVAQYSTQAAEGVLAKLAGDLILPQPPQDQGDAGGRVQCVEVVATQDPTAAGEGVLAELAGGLVAPQLPFGCWSAARSGADLLRLSRAAASRPRRCHERSERHARRHDRAVWGQWGPRVITVASRRWWEAAHRCHACVAPTLTGAGHVMSYGCGGAERRWRSWSRCRWRTAG